jgi:hypothetical protein
MSNEQQEVTNTNPDPREGAEDPNVAMGPSPGVPAGPTATGDMPPPPASSAPIFPGHEEAPTPTEAPGTPEPEDGAGQTNPASSR